MKLICALSSGVSSTSLGTLPRRFVPVRWRSVQAVKRNGEVDADISYSIGSVYALEGLHGDAFEWLERWLKEKR